MFVTRPAVSPGYGNAHRREGSTTHDGRAGKQLYDCRERRLRLRVRFGVPIRRVQLVVGWVRGKKQQLGSNAVLGAKGKAAKESREKEARNWTGSATKVERLGRLAGVAPSLAVGQAHSMFVSASRPPGFEPLRRSASGWLKT